MLLRNTLNLVLEGRLQSDICYEAKTASPLRVHRNSQEMVRLPMVLVYNERYWVTYVEGLFLMSLGNSLTFSKRTSPIS